MEVASLNAPSTADQASSARPSPRPRDYMDDSDSSLTRKRPRLDSGDRTYRSMSADELAATPSPRNHNQTLSASPQNNQPRSMVPTPSQTPCKVTINLRGSDPSTSQPSTSGPHQSTDQALQSHQQPIPKADATSVAGGISSPDVISVSSSPFHSPEIEVAEVEDIEDQTGETRWRTLGDATDPQPRLLGGFPYHRLDRTSKEDLDNIAQCIDTGKCYSTDRPFRDLGLWINRFLDSTESLRSQWRAMFFDQQDFWTTFPILVNLLTKRVNVRHGEPPFSTIMREDDDEIRDDLPLFLSAFAALTARMVKLDCIILNGLPPDYTIVHEPFSEEYLRAMVSFITFGPCTLWTVLPPSYGYDCRRVVTDIIVRFVGASSHGIENIAELVQKLVIRFPFAPGLITRLEQPMNAVYCIISHYRVIQDTVGLDTSALQDPLPRSFIKAYKIFELVDPVLQACISKQLPALTQHLADVMVPYLSAFLSLPTQIDENVAAPLLQKLPNLSHELSRQFGSAVIDLTWKFHLFRKCITEGRMEIRVLGVFMMKTELVNNVWQRFMKADRSNWTHPVAQYMSDFILDYKLVEYLVGVESHAQLIKHSNNIFGFLVVTQRYTEAQTDAIWKAVCTSQDSRLVDAVLDALSQLVPLAQYQIVLYYVQKLNELPLQNFENTMIVYARRLFTALLSSWLTERIDTEARLGLPPYHLCIRLIRQSAANKSLAGQKQKGIIEFATSQLGKLLPEGPNETGMNSIYQDCVAGISGGTQCATGSLSALVAIVGDHPKDSTVSLATKFNISSLVINEFASSIDTGGLRNLTAEDLIEHLEPRLKILRHIIVYAPLSIDSDSGPRLWDSMLGIHSLNGEARDRAWTMLADAVGECDSRNPFIDRFLVDHVPHLQPSSFATQHSLAFLSQVIQYESRVKRTYSDEQQTRLAPSGIELLWHLAIVVPPGTIEIEAIDKLVSYYLDLPNGQSSPRSVTKSIYIEVVERCIRQLTDAASKLKASSGRVADHGDEAVGFAASEEEATAYRLSFTRSLLIMKAFVKGARSRPTFSPTHKPSVLIPSDDHQIKGMSMSVPYQIFSGGAAGGIRRIGVGDQDTLGDLSRRLQNLSGFAEFTLIAGGRRIDMELSGEKTLQEIKINQSSFLLVKQSTRSMSGTDAAVGSDLKPLEGEIMKQFHTLYDLLAMEDGLAKEMYDFLLTFPPHINVEKLVCGDETPIAEAFPEKVPYQILYSMHTLKSCLLRRLHNGTASQLFISRGVQLSSEVLTSSTIVGRPLGGKVHIETATGLVECLFHFMKEPTSATLSANYVSDPSSFVDRLESCIEYGLMYKGSRMAEELTFKCFAVLLEASLYCGNVWEYLKAAGRCANLFRILLLETPTEGIRQEVAFRLQGLCAAMPTLETTTSRELIPYFWAQLRSIIPCSLEYAGHCQQFFEVAVIIFQSLDHIHRESLESEALIREWSRLLLAHERSESIGSYNIDWVSSGISNLLHNCVQVAKEYKKPMHIDSELTEQLFNTCLFPEIPNDLANANVSIPTPILHSQTRHDLYQSILSLTTDVEGCRRLVGLARELPLTGEDRHAWSWGLAQSIEDTPQESNWNLERLKLVRSPTGYPGMRNLSNTCYLNSLFTQLFMNVRFREFMLKIYVADGGQSQRLLSETKTLFAFMQGTVLKAVEAQGIVDSIVTYDGVFIDVAVQMDVEEFFNLLFDRWESQILSSTDKTAFRKIYGGQIVQQISSKECQHISERLEPFSAIQCDIQGKPSLKESLDAYVSGEVMEGENKYSCTSCGNYVDAVKRACLKDVPDNLIFHLKRFDYDLMTGVRSKINDRFEFPHEIDMSPYNVDYLKNPEQPPVPDMFELVGVLVHSGTAESGHYYSYIRERPVSLFGSERWVEFNDADVATFDISNLADQCFGGLTDPSPYTCYTKHWNAYMLFYQRKDALLSDIKTYRPPNSGSPVKISLPADLHDRIALDNAIFERKFCLLDPSYASFATNLLEQLGQLKKNICSEDHLCEQDAIWLALNTMDKVFCRAKDCLGFEKMLGALTRMIGNCTRCCKIAIDWVALFEHNVRPMLLRCPVPKTRRDFAAMIFRALRHLRENDPSLYGLRVGEGTSEASRVEFLDHNGAFPSIVRCLAELREKLPLHARGWDDYFGLLTDLASFGSQEAHIIVCEGFLKYCLEILIVEHPEAKRPLSLSNMSLAKYIQLVKKGRKYSLHKLLELLQLLLQQVDLAEEPIEDNELEERPILEGKLLLTTTENDYIHFGELPQLNRILAFLDKAIGLVQNDLAARRIVEIMLLAEPQANLLLAVQRTILGGINIEPASAAGPYLRAALVFCEFCPNQVPIKEVIKAIALEVDTIGIYGGKEHFEFFHSARRLSNTRAPKSQSSFHRLVLQTVPHWAPALIMYCDENIRARTIDLLRVLLFDPDVHNMDDEREADEIQRVGRELCAKCVKRIEECVVEPRKTVDSKSVENVIQVISHCSRTYLNTTAYRSQCIHAERVLSELLTLTTVVDYDAISDTWNDENSTNPSDSESEILEMPGGL